MTDLTTRVEAIERHLGISEQTKLQMRCVCESTICGYTEWVDFDPLSESQRFAMNGGRWEYRTKPDAPPTPTRLERSQEYKDAMVAAQKAGIPVQFKFDAAENWGTKGHWGFKYWNKGDYRIDPAYQQPAKPAQRVARECWICFMDDQIKVWKVNPYSSAFTLFREVLPDE